MFPSVGESVKRKGRPESLKNVFERRKGNGFDLNAPRRREEETDR